MEEPPIAPLRGTAEPAPCVRCRRLPGKHQLRLHGQTLPGRYCCGCVDTRMDELGRTVDKAEYEAGLESFRRQHLEECGYKPAGWEPSGG